MHGWGVGGSGLYDVALGVCENLLWYYLPSGDYNFSCTQIGDNAGCLDARSLTSPRHCPGVRQSAKAETYVNHREVLLIAVPRSSDLFSLKYYQYIFRIHLARLVEVFNDVHSFRDPIV